MAHLCRVLAHSTDEHRLRSRAAHAHSETASKSSHGVHSTTEETRSLSYVWHMLHRTYMITSKPGNKSEMCDEQHQYWRKKIYINTYILHVFRTKPAPKAMYDLLKH